MDSMPPSNPESMSTVWLKGLSKIGYINYYIFKKFNSIFNNGKSFASLWEKSQMGKKTVLMTAELFNIRQMPKEVLWQFKG